MIKRVSSILTRPNAVSHRNRNLVDKSTSKSSVEDDGFDHADFLPTEESATNAIELRRCRIDLESRGSSLGESGNFARIQQNHRGNGGSHGGNGLKLHVHLPLKSLHMYSFVRAYKESKW